MRIIIITICILFQIKTFSQSYMFNLNFGKPIQNSFFSKSKSIDFRVSKIIKPKHQLGVGSSYVEVDLEPSKTILTFDKKIFSLYGTYVYRQSFNQRLKFLFFSGGGYSFIKSRLNEFYDIEQRNSGLYLSGDVFLSYKIFDKICFVTGVSYSKTFSKLKISPDVHITYY